MKTKIFFLVLLAALLSFQILALEEMDDYEDEDTLLLATSPIPTTPGSTPAPTTSSATTAPPTTASPTTSATTAPPTTTSPTTSAPTEAVPVLDKSKFSCRQRTASLETCYRKAGYNSTSSRRPKCKTLFRLKKREGTPLKSSIYKTKFCFRRFRRFKGKKKFGKRGRGRGRKKRWKNRLKKRRRKKIKFVKKLMMEKYCKVNTKNCVNGRYKYDKSTIQNFLVEMLNIDVNSLVKEVRDQIRNFSVEPLSGFQCEVKSKRNSRKVKVCRKFLGEQDKATRKCRRLFRGRLKVKNETSRVKYATYACLKKSQGRRTLNRLKRYLRKQVKESYCVKYKSNCKLNKRNKLKYKMDIRTWPQYQYYLLNSNPVVDLTKLPKGKKKNKKKHFKFGGFGTGAVGKSYKKFKVRIAVKNSEGRVVFVKRLVRLDRNTGEFYLEPAKTEEGKKQDAQILNTLTHMNEAKKGTTPTSSSTTSNNNSGLTTSASNLIQQLEANSSSGIKLSLFALMASFIFVLF